MKDFVTDAYTIYISPSRDFDKSVCLFTESFGKIEAKAVSARKPLSKFSPHLEPLQKVTVRLAKRNGFTITDILTHTRCVEVRKTPDLWSSGLRSLFLIYKLSPKELPDNSIWLELESMLLSGILSPKIILSHLGYDIHHARCDICGVQSIVGFDIKTHEFVCFGCAKNISESRIVVL